MTSALPSRRFRDAKLLIGIALLTLVAMVAVEMVGVLSVAGLVEEEARRATSTAALVLSGELSSGDAARYFAALRTEGWGLAVLQQGGVVRSVGEGYPEMPAWWPWTSQEQWERAGSGVAGPLRWAGRDVLVGYQPLADGRVVRVVQQATRAGIAAQWRVAGALLALVVGLGGGILAWRLIARALAPYRELLAEAVRVTRGPGQEPEDRFLVATFREAVQRLEVSEAGARQRADELEVLTQVLTREAASGVIITDAGGTVRAHNPAAQGLVGAELAVGQALPDVLAEAGRRSTRAERALEVRGFPLLTSTGAGLGQVVFITDRTSLEVLERALAEREQMALLGELSAGMAHELRNALATIRGYLRLLPEAEEARRRQFIGAMEEEARGLGVILDRFLGFAQPHELQRQRMNLGELAEEEAVRLRASFPLLDLEVDTPAVWALVDRMAIGVILENLLRNAAEAVAVQGGRVTIRTVPGDEQARVVVEDDGPGVSVEVVDRLFRPFVSTKPSGGLGLAMSRRLARLHGGEIDYEERTHGGSRFVLTLPTGEAP